MNNETDRQKHNLDNENLTTMSNTNRIANQRLTVNHKTKKNELKRGFKIAHLNIRSLVKNIDQLRLYLQNQQFDVISINFNTTKTTKNNCYQAI